MHEIDTCTVRSKWQHENDPTWLSDVEGLVANIIQKLLLLTNSTIPAHISVIQLHCFKTLYSSIGLHCRYSSCKNQCVTYRSEIERRKHERAHVRSYRCMECDFAKRPFTSRQDLRKHQEKYHTITVDFAIPLQIRSLATKNLPPLRRKTQRLGARQSCVGLSPIDQPSPSDLRTTISNVKIDVHQNTQTTREYADPNAQTTREDAARSKDLDLTDTSERDDMETFGSAELASTSFTESVFAHKLESVGKLKATHSPEICSISEANFPVGEPIQSATETSHENPLAIDHVGESHHEPNTCNKNPSEQIDVVYVENSTKSNLRFEYGDSERVSVESCVARHVGFAVNVHTERHGLPPNAISMDEEARRIRSCAPPGAQLNPDAYFSCSRECWYNSIGPYVSATFANENAIPGISKEDTERRLMELIRTISNMGRNISHAFLKPLTRSLPQEMIRFERSIKLDGDAAMDVPTFWEKFKMWGPKHLKEHHQRSMSQMNAYLDVDANDIAHWLYNYIGRYIHDRSYVLRFPEAIYSQDWIRNERIDAHSELWADILRIVHPDRRIVHRPVGIDVERFTHYAFSLPCKERKPTEMVESLEEYLKPSK